MTTSNPRILAIDDDPEVLRMVEQVLGARFACELADDVSSARERLAADGFDAVLCDVQMPGASGLALVEDLLTEYPHVAVIPVARVDDETVVERALELGVYGYLVKPFLAGQLQITVQTALRRRDAEAAERMRRRTLAEHVQAAMDRAPLPIFVKDLERRYLLASSFTHEVIDLEAGGMIGHTDAELIPEAEPVIREGDLRVLRDEEPVYREETMELMGRQRTFLTVRFPYINAEGDLAGIVGVATEITAQREAERQQRERSAAHARTIEELRFSQQEAVERLAQAIELHDAAGGRHVNRMARISSYLASQLGLGDEQIGLLRTAAAMHDIGKIATPAEILCKPEPLTLEEQSEMERHTEVGHRILAGSESELLQMAARIALTHHEWFDGSGYPQGLKGEEIPIEGRIAAVADVFDALLSERPYRPAMDAKEAVEVIRDGHGTHFDPETVDVLLEHLADALTLRD
jgi:response regulator RpfG family c-di-GMP phosphodiesterase